MTISNREVRDEFKQAQAQGGGRQPVGTSTDQDAAGGSGGAGAELAPPPAQRELSRGERFDLAQGGGRAVDAVDPEEEPEEDRQGQDYIDSLGDAGSGAATERRQP